MNFKSMTVSARLAVSFGVILCISFLVALVSVNRLTAIQDNLRDIVLDNSVKIEINNHMAESVHVVSRIMRSVVLLQDPAAKETERAKLAKAREAYDKAWAELEKFVPSEKGQALRTAIAAARDAARPLNSKVLELDQAGDAAGAIQLLFAEANPATQKWQEVVDANIEFQKNNNLQQFEESEREYEQAKWLLIGANVLTLLLAVVLGWRVTRSITSQLGGEPGVAATLAQAVAAGDLTVHVQLRDGDRTSMMAHLQEMKLSLVKVVGQVRAGSESVSTASSEIAQGNSDLSARTEQQASALEETAASMEELSSAVKQNAESAQQANQLAQSASVVAIKGGEVVGEVVETMKGINDASRKIADIIGVIDGIAFQTNILALNAAVEAARAGEQGRGFAVVASEVRSLAGRSAEAAKEIKTLINASVERVEAGATLVDQAGTTMAEVVGSIKRVTDLMGEISAASNEQSAGVSQIGEAVQQMDQVTQQNAALVEEMAAAASSLRSQSQDLVQVVATFKLHESANTSSSTPVAAAARRPAAAPIRKPVSLSAATATAKRPVAPSTAKPVALPKPVQSSSAGNDDWESF